MNGPGSPIDGDDGGKRSPEQRERMRRAFLARIAEHERRDAPARGRRWVAPASLACACVAGGTVVWLWLHRPHLPPLAADVVTNARDVPLAATGPKPVKAPVGEGGGEGRKK